MKNLFLLIFILGTSLSNAQEEIVRFGTKYADFTSLPEYSFTVSNDSTKNLVTFLGKKSNIAAFYFDKEFQLINRLFSNKLPDKFKIPLGSTVANKKYTLFYSNELKNKFAGVYFNFENNSTDIFVIDFKLKKEVFLTGFNHNNTFFVLSASYRENKLFLYKFDTTGGIEKKIIDLSEFQLYGAADYPTRLKSTLALDINNNPLTDIIFIKNKVPYSLDSMVSLLKLYIDKNSFYLVSDINKNFTQLISYNFKTEVPDVVKINYGVQGTDYLNNSFLLKEKLFQLKVGSKDLSYQITDINTGDILNDFLINKDEELFLTDDAIKQRGGLFKKYRELEKTSQFIKKLRKGRPSVFAEESDSGYNVYLGSVDEIDNNALFALAYLNPVGIVGTIGSLTVAINPAAFAFYMASNTKAVYICNTLDKNFGIQPSKESENIFYTIRDYLENQEIKKYTAGDIFINNNHFLFGMLDKKSRDYIFLKFDKN